MRTSRWVLLGSMLCLTASLEPLARAATRPLNRSVYIPVRFKLCPHLINAVILVDDQVAGTLPSDRTFQFTYYPELKRLAPNAVQLEVRGDRTEGHEPFVGRIAITPEGIHTASQHIAFDLAKQMSQLRYHVDVRADRVSLTIKCHGLCPGKALPAPVPATASASTTGGPKEQ